MDPRVVSRLSCMRRGRISVLAVLLIATVPALSQGFATEQPLAGTSLPAPIAEKLAETKDFAFDFDQPGFYALVEWVQGNDENSADAIEIEDWRTLVERPNDFRGRLVRIRGRVGRNKPPYRLQARPALGLLTQLELSQPGHGVSATVICTTDVGDVTLGAEAEFVGRFVMVRNFHTDNGRVGQAVLIVSPAPISLSEEMPASAQKLPALGKWLFYSLLTAAVIFWVILRRANRSGKIVVGETELGDETAGNLEEYLATNVDAAGVVDEDVEFNKGAED